MDAFTLFVIVVIIASGAWGWSKGFVNQISQVVGLLLAIAACRIFGDAVCRLLGGDSLIITLMAYIIIFIAVYLGVWIIGNMLRSTMKVLKIGIVNRIGGVIFSVVKWLIFLSLLLNVYNAFAPDSELNSSPAYRGVLHFAPTVLGTDIAHQIGKGAHDLIKG